MFVAHAETRQAASLRVGTDELGMDELGMDELGMDEQATALIP